MDLPILRIQSPCTCNSRVSEKNCLLTVVTFLTLFRLNIMIFFCKIKDVSFLAVQIYIPFGIGLILSLKTCNPIRHTSANSYLNSQPAGYLIYYVGMNLLLCLMHILEFWEGIRQSVLEKFKVIKLVSF